MKITVITPVYNGADTIRTCIESVKGQTYAEVEYIIVDGGSTDHTVDIIKSMQYEKLKWVSEKDKGLYDAFNKGILMATGEVVCFLCADDMYANEQVLQKAAEAFTKNPDVEMVYNDLVYLNREDIRKIDRYWKSSQFKPGLFKKGWLPPNTAWFIKRKNFLTYGLFDLRFKMAADFELQYRFFEKHRLRSLYIPGISVNMRSGGMSNSNMSGMYTSLKECYDALKLNHVRFPIRYIFNTIFYRMNQLIIPKELKTKYRQKGRNHQDFPASLNKT